MKVGIATTLSIAGVLVAGAAAFAVNSNVLSTSSSIASTVTDPVVAPIVDAVTTIPGQVAEQSTKVDSSVLNNNTTTYKVGTSGSVVIDLSTGAIVVNNVLPAAGWSSEPAQVQPNGDVKVRFASTATRVDFLAHLVSGKVTVTVAAEPITPVDKPVATQPTKPSVPFSGDDDEEHENKNGHDEDDD